MLGLGLVKTTGPALRIGQARGPGAAARSPSSSAVKPRASRSDGQ